MREADIVIHSVIENSDGTGELERAHTETAGELSFTEDGARLSWRETNEGGSTESTLTVAGDTVSVVRRGAIENTFNFKEGVSSESLYKAGPYSFDSCVKTRRVRATVGENGVSVTVIYDMELGGAVRLVKMKIRATCHSEGCDA